MNSDDSGTCTICFNSYQKPIQIFCGHTFCFECINKWYTQAKKMSYLPSKF